MRHSRDRAARTPRRLKVVAVALALGALSAGCGGSGEGDSGAGVAGSAIERSADSAGAEQAPEREPGAANRAAVQTRSVIKTGQIAVTGKDLDQTRRDVDGLLLALDGSIDSEQTSHDDAGRIERSTLVLRVPVANFEAAMDTLEKLGTTEASNSTSKDVTTEVIDVNERVETLQNSLDRLQRFQRRSGDIKDLVRFEDQITQRESELRSLQSQQAFLVDQTAMSTITVNLSTPATYVPPPDALEDAGFLAGLRSGWDGLTNFVVVALTVFGAVLPFAVSFALVGVPTWLLVRGLLRIRLRS